jgi:hypothetical protein
MHNRQYACLFKEHSQCVENSLSAFAKFIVLEIISIFNSSEVNKS